MRDWIDSELNKVSMYRLLSVSLSVLVAFSVLLSLFDQVPYAPGEIIVSAAALVLAAYACNVSLGWLFNVRTHDESSYITALILFFILSPTLDLVGLATLALVAAFAVSSKFILAPHGRHIFNPAAIAAVVASGIGLAPAVWWIATPVLLPLVTFFAFLILYKTRRLQLGALFLGIAALIIVALSVLDGQSLYTASIALLSWPLIFFAGFMLSEPLTLPPRRWQQYAVGTVAAVFFAVPLQLGAISGSPALALVIANIVAFTFTYRRHIRLTFIDRKPLTPSIYEYTFKIEIPIAFTAGQYIEITLPHKHKDGRGIRRIFTLIGSDDALTVRFSIRINEHPSSFKRALQELRHGDYIDATGISGDFVMPHSTETPLLFVAGGVGITPFISHLTQLRKDKQSRDITLIYAVNTIDDIAYADELKRAAIHVIIICKTREPLPVPSWNHVNESHIDSNDITRHIPDVAARSIYISGPPAMVAASKSILKHSGAKHVHTDYFTGY